MKKQKMKKIAASLFVSSVLVAAAKSPVLANWNQQENGNWKWEENGQNTTDSWKQINGKWYYFNEAGIMQSGWLEKNGEWYYLEPQNGEMKQGWVKLRETWYFLNSNTGTMAKGWIKTGDKWYFLDNSGSMQTGVIEVDGKVYALDETNGNMYTGTVLLSDKKVYTFNPVTGEAVGDIIPIPAKAYQSNGQKQADISSTVREQIQKMEEKKKEESRYSSSSSSSSSSKPDKDNSNNNNNQGNNPNDNNQNNTTEISIQEISVPKNGMVTVVLSSAVTLDDSNFYINCPVGKDMTILKVETEEGSEKEKIYHLTTAYFDDNTYIMQITLPDGKLLEKTFVTNSQAPQIKDIETKRQGANTAEITFVSDDVGILYYMAVPASKSRAAIVQTEPQSGEDIKKNGNSIQIASSGFQKFVIEGLEEKQAYQLYLATASGENDIPVMRGSVSILPETEIEEGEIKIVEAEGVSSSEIKVVFNKPTTEVLTIENFEVTCPAVDNISIGRAETQDQKTYTIYMKDYYFMMSNNTYTVHVTFSDGSKTEGKFYGDFEHPIISGKEIKRISEEEIEVTFRTKEGGKFYYGTTSDTDNLPSIDEIVRNAKTSKLYAGNNVIRIPVQSNDKLVYIITEDERGNRAQYRETVKIPEYQGNIEEEKTNEITSIATSKDFMGNLVLNITFKNPIDLLQISYKEISTYTLEGEGTSGVPAVIFIEPAGVSETFRFTYNVAFPNGTYRLEIQNGKEVYKKEFQIKE